jgi:hydrogenase maturation protein HypF
MREFIFPFKIQKNILALGGESAGNFSLFSKNKIYFSEDFGDLLEEKNFQKFQKSLLSFLKKKKIKPEIVITDLHPLYKTTILGEKLSKKYKAKLIKVQHHLAHIFSAFGEKIFEDWKLKIEDFFGIASDGTGYGLDGKIWGGEIFKLKIKNEKLKIIERIGHLENQVIIGGDLAIREPARMLISILNKVREERAMNNEQKKNFIYKFLKKFYNKNQFTLLYNQFRQNFNCQETSSTGRVLDAVSLFLGFAKNQRDYKHQPIDLLEKNSTTPYQITPKIIYEKKEKKYLLLTTPLFEYLIKNLNKDKKRLAATAQLYLAKGFYEVVQKQKIKSKKQNIYFAGGIANNKIISSYLESKGVYINKKFPRGDGGLSFGQLIYCLFSLQLRKFTF